MSEKKEKIGVPVVPQGGIGGKSWQEIVDTPYDDSAEKTLIKAYKSRVDPITRKEV